MIAILSANLGKFDENHDPVKQNIPVIFKRWTDDDFPPITGLSGRFQYRIPKLFGWQMLPGFEAYLWLDGSMSLQHPGAAKWFSDQLAGHDIVLFKHPWRNTIKEEVEHIEEKLKSGNKYIVSRYANGLHKEQYDAIKDDPRFVDDKLYASTVFMYQNSEKVRNFLDEWWYFQSRYYTCDQVVLPYVVQKHKLKVREIAEDQFNIPYLSLTSKHK